MRTAVVGIILVLFGLGIAYANDDELGLTIKKRSDEVVRESHGFEDKVRALRQYVHKRMPFDPNLNPDKVYPLDTIQRLDSGLGGYCDQQADVFMRLAQKQGITTQKVWLYLRKHKDINDSCHTIAEALDGNRWVIVDPTLNLELKNKDGKMASRDDVTGDLDIIRRLPNFGELEKRAPCRKENSEEWLEIYSKRNPSRVDLYLRGDSN